MDEKERYDLESRISAARCELAEAKKNIEELHEIMEKQAKSNARMIADALKKDEEIERLQAELDQIKAERDAAFELNPLGRTEVRDGTDQEHNTFRTFY